MPKPGPTARGLVLAILLITFWPSARADGETSLFGPVTYTREAGRPELVEDGFTVSTPNCVSAFLRLTNGDAEGEHRVSSAEVTVNGALVLGPSDFNQQVSELVVPVDNLQGVNHLTVRLASEPGGFVILEIVDSGDGPVLPPAPILDPYPILTRSPTASFSGLAPCAVSVEIAGPSGVLTVEASSESFAADVALRPNGLNSIFFTGISESGLRSAPTVARITHDAQPPSLFIDLPAPDAQLTTPTTDVAGRVGDLLSGFTGLGVTVNGIPATVNVGIGNNGTFFAGEIPLLLGQPTPIAVVAVDRLGNSTSREIQVTQVEIPPDAPRLELISGNAQTAEIESLLPQPLVVRLSRADGTPFADKIVTFEVIRSNGRLSEDGGPDGAMTLQVRTDATGEARAFWQLGSDAGFGNNRLQVRSASVAGTVFFCASAEPAPPEQINVGSGNNQRAEAGAPAPEPLVAWVSDGCNGVAGVPVTFRVVHGGGTVDGAAETTVDTGLTGHAAVQLMLGPDGGNQIVEASFPGNPGAPAEFVAFGVVRGAGQPTSFSGLVLDNAERPVGGAECVLTVNGVDLPPVLTDAGGRFELSGIPDGAAHLHVDGLVATLLNGQPIPQGSFPALAYETVVVPNAANSLPTPVLLPMLNPNNARLFDNTHDIELQVEEIAGLKMIIRAGSMTRADGTVPSPSDPAILALNQVHHDDVPMPMPDGAAPPFAWTLQPAGAHFDPPIEIVYPNMSGLPAGSIAYFLSFNHDTNRFEIVASGSVTADGSSIVSDPGVGISTAGWGCNCPPYSVTAKCESCSVTATLGDAEIDAGGTKDVVCVITNTSNGTCKFDWKVTKTAGTPTVNPMPPSGSVTLGPNASVNTPLAMMVPANSAARDDATMKLDVTGDASASDTGTVCVKPTGETTVFVNFPGGPTIDIAAFKGRLTPATADFTGRMVTEDPVGSGTNTTDTCWFPGSALPRYTNANSISGGTWTIVANNEYNIADNIGFSGDLDGYYSAQGRTPCDLHTEQHMKIICPSGPIEYRVNPFDLAVRAGGTTISRDGVAAPAH